MTQTGILNSKEKELVGVSISVAVGCQSCTAYHVRVARENEATDTELNHFLGLALAVCVQATHLMAQVGREQITGSDKELEARMTSESLLDALAQIGAADAVNCTSALSFHLEEARQLSVTQEHLKETFALVAQIKKIAASQVKKLDAEFLAEIATTAGAAS